MRAARLAARRAGHLQDGRHLRGRVRGVHARTTTPPTRRRTRSARPSAPGSIILGSGPNRIGQGIEFDYCCVHASMSLRDAGYETVMINCNPETVSTDYDTSDRLYFEPLTDEDVANVLEAELAAGGRWPGSSCRSAARRRSSWPAPSRPSWCSGPARPPSTWPRTVSAGTRCARELEIPQPPGRHGDDRRPRRSPSPGEVGYPVLAAPELRPRAAGPWRSSTTTRACAGSCSR